MTIGSENSTNDSRLIVMNWSVYRYSILLGWERGVRLQSAYEGNLWPPVTDRSQGEAGRHRRSDMLDKVSQRLNKLMKAYNNVTIIHVGLLTLPIQ